MGERFTAGVDGKVSMYLEDAEKAFLLDLVTMLESIGEEADDPGEKRLNVPVYLGDENATDEWRRLMGDQLEDGRSRDRGLLRQLLTGPSPVRIEYDEALSVLRVINESRLVLAARMGIEVESDYEDLDLGSTIALHMLGLLLEDLTEELGGSFD